MILLVKVMSIAVIVWGCILILRPDTLKKVFHYVKEGNRLYIASGIKTVIGVILMFAASYCSIPWIVLFFGAIMAFGGAAGFLMKEKVLLKMVDWVEGSKKKTVYMIGAIALVVGILLALAV